MLWFAITSAEARVTSTDLQLDETFSFQSVLIDKILAFFDMVVWPWRDHIRDQEKVWFLIHLKYSLLMAQTRASNLDYDKMHEMARHIIHTSGILTMAIETMTSFIKEHKIHFKENISPPNELIAESKDTRRTLRSQVAFFKYL